MFSERIMTDEEWEMLTGSLEKEASDEHATDEAFEGDDYEADDDDMLGRTVKRRHRKNRKRRKPLTGIQKQRRGQSQKKYRRSQKGKRTRKTYTPKPGSRRRSLRRRADDGSLRAKVIKLARQRPELAPMLDRILREASDIAVDKSGIELYDLNDKPVMTNRDGTLTLYHRTSRKNAEKIKAAGFRRSKFNLGESYFSTKADGAATGYGESLVVVRIHPRYVNLDDAFRNGEVHVYVEGRDLKKAKNIQIA